MTRDFKPLILLFFPFIFASCAPKQLDVSALPTHNPAVFAKGLYCTDYLKFACLPESRDKELFDMSKPYVYEDGILYEDEVLYVTSQEATQMNQANKISEETRKTMPSYKMSPADSQLFRRVEFKEFMNEMEAEMEKQYPGFWGETPRKVRHRWMRLCMAKAVKYGYNTSNIRERAQFIELCGRIGLYFDRDPKWQYIVDYIKLPESPTMGYAGEAVRYIDFTVYGKDYDGATRLTDWSLRALQHLPKPNRPVPKLGGY